VSLSLNPLVRHDHFWWSDPVPGFVQAAQVSARSCRRVGQRVAWRLRARRRRHILRRRRLEHAGQMAQGAYFPGALARILFVCHGNLCRSPFAEHYWHGLSQRQPLPEALSAGLAPDEDRPTPAWVVRLAAEYAVDLSRHRSRAVTDRQALGADAVFVMDRRSYFDLAARFPDAADRIYLLGWFEDDGNADIGDPYDKTTAVARQSFDRAIRALHGLAACLSAGGRGRAERGAVAERVGSS
jgi:protein-tyrosine phosphatase